MKKTLSLLLAVALIVPFCALFAHADSMPVQCCITWKLFPTQKTDTRDYIKSSYIAEMHFPGDDIAPPDVIPKYSRDGIDYIFIGWKLASLQEIKSYWNDPTLGYTPATFKQEELIDIMPSDDVNYLAVYYHGIPGDLDLNGTVNVADVTALLDYLSRQVSLSNSWYDIDRSGVASVSDVTTLLGMLL